MQGQADAPARWPSLPALPLPGSTADAAYRLRQLQGLDPSDGSLLRSVGTEVSRRFTGADTLLLFGPELFLGYNSAHPWGFNDGPLRPGRGTNLMLSSGVAVVAGPLQLVAVPQVVHEANLDFQTIPYVQGSTPARNEWANWFYRPPMSADYPQRFGPASRTAVSVQGRLALEFTSAARFGLSTENRWWGPGVRNALVLSAQGPGFAHLFVESAKPITTRLGDFEYQYLLGRLDESEFFDTLSANDGRSLSAVALTWRAPGRLGNWPAVGVSRAVIAQQGPGVATMLDFGRNVGRQWSRPADSTSQRDQIFALFARWRFPEQGVEAYVEWAKLEQVANLREALEQPGHMQAYTLGAQWARPWRNGTLHFQTEFSYLEPSASWRSRPVGTTFTSRAVPQGWTQQGQMLGPAIGPGASSQYAALDFYRPRWRTGFSLGRWRRDANYRFVYPQGFLRDDLQLWASFRAGWALGPLDALLEFTNGVRLNHLYQAYDLNTPGGDTEGVDLLNRALTLTLTPRLPQVIR